MHPDQVYITAFRNNNKPLIEMLYKKCAPKIKALVLHNNGTETDAADLLQDAMLTIYNKVTNAHFVLTCTIEAFIYIICRKNWLKELNKKQRMRVTITDISEYCNMGDDSFIKADECIKEQEQKALLTQKFELLGEGCRKLLNLSWEGKPMDEVAAILHISYAYARKRKCECMAKLVLLVRQSNEYKNLK